MSNFKQKLESLLKQEESFLDIETKEINYNKVKDSADKIDEKLITILADNKETRDKFFTKIKDIYVFNINDFKFFLDENKVNNSYTQYANQIGLSDGVEFLKDRTDVVLEFPFKDCVLEGGQSTEEGTDTYFEYHDKNEKYEEKQSKRNEIFFNQVLAHDEIDRLFDKKALINWKRFTKDSGKDGENVGVIKRNKDGLINENLIIKGNNLLALHSLKSEFAGKVKLIYIDPPYNTGSDSFKYNDNFNHSSWLTFMKNRLEVAKDLLREDGIICIQCDFNQDSYLKVLMDEIFKNLYITTITVKSNSISGNKTQHKDKTILKNKDSILVYKNGEKIKLFPQYAEKTEWDTHYNSILIKNEENDYTIKNLKDVMVEKGVIDEKYIIKPISISNVKFYDFIFKNKENIFRGVNSIPAELKKISIKNKDKVVCIEGRDEKMFAYNGSRLSFLSKAFKSIDGSQKMAQLLGDLWTDIDFQNTQNEGGVSLTNGKKPEALLRRIIDLTTTENDIVMDYHFGSGTTGAVAHKMNRQYIGIEQLDYGKNDSVVRLLGVIGGDETGISKSVKWEGGGNFIYTELAKWNEQAKDEINEAKDLKTLEKMFSSLCEKYFLNYNVKVKDFKEKIIKEENFKKLTLNEQKKMFLTMLDLNQMYVQKSEMADKRFGISKEDQKLTKDFYQIK